MPLLAQELLDMDCPLLTRCSSPVTNRYRSMKSLRSKNRLTVRSSANGDAEGELLSQDNLFHISGTRAANDSGNRVRNSGEVTGVSIEHE